MAAGAVSAPLIIPIIHPQVHRAKNHIDTNTPVSIQSETAGVAIFFTLDGSKPVTVRGQRGAAGSTKKYSELITLPAGRVTVRAMAVTSDYRQSSVVTKVFSVDLVDDGPSLQQLCSDGSPDTADVSRLGSTGASIMANGGSRSAGPRFPNQRFGSDSAAAAATDTRPEDDDELSSSQKSRPQPYVNFLQCLQCHSVHLSGPLAGFCAECGAFIPPRPAPRMPPAEGGQDHVVCVCCGTENPAHISTCVTCESDLQQVQCCWNHSASCGRQAESEQSSCKQIKEGGARDWTCKCGQVARCVMCCSLIGSPDSLYCACCGVFLQALPTLSSDITGGQQSAVKEAPPTVDQHTQTVGLYYPSATTLQRKEQKEVLQLNRELASRDRRPPLSAVSPGKGFWRMQLDHVCAHLRSHAQNHASFRAVLGEPRLGRVVSAAVHEDGAEVSVTVTFESVKDKQQKQVKDWQLLEDCGGISTVLDPGAEPAGCRSDDEELTPWRDSSVGASWGGRQPADEEHGSARGRH